MQYKACLLPFPLLLILLLSGCGQSDKASAPEEKSSIGSHLVQTPARQAAEITGSPIAASAPINGEQVYSKVCVSCHGPGIAGAPKMGDRDAWKHRLGQGMETLIEHAINGFTGEKGAMPPKGGNPGLSNAEVAAAVRFMVNQSR